MMLPEYWDHLVAWGFYLLSGLGCCLVCWRWTRHFRNRALRGILRGTFFVLIFTPWMISDSVIEQGKSIDPMARVEVEGEHDTFMAPAVIIERISFSRGQAPSPAPPQ